MKKIILLLSLLTVLVACNTKQVDYAIVTINSPQKSAVFALNNTDTTVEVKLNNGKYVDTIKNVNQYYYLVAGQYELTMYLEGGDNITINLTPTLDKVTYTGKGANKQTYLLDKQLKINAYGAKINEWYSQNGADFKQKIQKIINEINGILKTAHLSDDFTKTEQQSIAFTHYNLLSSYPSYHEFLTGKKTTTVEKYVPNDIRNFDFNNEKFYSTYREYQGIVVNYYMNIFYKNIKESYPTIGKKDIAFMDKIKITQLKEDLLGQCIYFMSSSSEKLQEFYDALTSYSTNAEYKRHLTKKFNILKNLTKGKTSPEFAYTQPNGDIVELKNLRGKYVYIDVWATWCGPCKKEIPALKKLEEKMSGKNIAFVSISVDSPQDKEKWKKFVKENEMGGIQLFADNAFNSFFIKQYGIDAIPRFILLDKKGNIISADAPKPSSDKIESFLNKNIN